MFLGFPANNLLIRPQKTGQYQVVLQSTKRQTNRRKTQYSSGFYGIVKHCTVPRKNRRRKLLNVRPRVRVAVGAPKAPINSHLRSFLLPRKNHEFFTTQNERYPTFKAIFEGLFWWLKAVDQIGFTTFYYTFYITAYNYMEIMVQNRPNPSLRGKKYTSIYIIYAFSVG